MTDRFLQELAQPTLTRSTVVPRLETFSYYEGPLNFTWLAFLKISDLSPSPISDGNSLVGDHHKRPLRDVSLRIKFHDETIIDDDVLPKLREIQAIVNLTIVAAGIPLVISKSYSSATG